MQLLPEVGSRSFLAAAILSVIAGITFCTPGSAETISISLKTALQEAVQNSQVVEEARYVVDEANAQVREAWSEVYPEIRSNATYVRNLEPQQGFLPAVFFDPDASPDDVVPVRFGADNSWNAEVSLRQPIFELDLFIGVGATNRYKELQQERYRGTSQDVLLDTREAFLMALLVEEDRRIVAERIRRVTQTRDEAAALYRAGLTGEFDVLTLEVQLADLEPNLRRAEYAAANANRQLLIEMGHDPDTGIDISGHLGEMDVTGSRENSTVNQELLDYCGDTRLRGLDAKEVYQIALENRSDMRQLRLDIELEKKRVSAGTAEYFPKLSLFGSYNVVAQENDTPNFFGENANQRFTTSLIGVQLDFPLFEGFRRSARVQQSKAAVLQRETRLTRVEYEAMSEIELLIDRVDEARFRAGKQFEAVQKGQRGYTITTAEFREGIGTRLQVTEAELRLSESEFNYAQAVYDYLIAVSRLDQAAGVSSAVLVNLAPQLALEGDDK